MFLIYLVFSVYELILSLSLLIRLNYEFDHKNLKIINLIYLNDNNNNFYIFILIIIIKVIKVIMKINDY